MPSPDTEAMFMEIIEGAHNAFETIERARADHHPAASAIAVTAHYLVLQRDIMPLLSEREQGIIRESAEQFAKAVTTETSRSDGG